ncbi:hypothetical protein BC830DRAFT_1118790 [Chytriomyces sp. MP71]|nr:hypothetical protein BC830DRAFT_1118790 [Chytriomyces sp. MP71]
MEATLKNMPTSQKLKASAFVRFCRDAVRAARRDLAKYTTGVAFISDRTQLLSGATNHGATSISIDSADTRSRLLQSTERLQGGSQRLENIQRIALESETIGASTLGDLGRQREQIVRTRNTLDSADSWITQSTGVLRGMQWQATRGTLIQYGCIVILILLILIVFYFKYLK